MSFLVKDADPRIRGEGKARLDRGSLGMVDMAIEVVAAHVTPRSLDVAR